MRQVIDFRSSNGDTDYPESSAILPLTDGEAANQTVLRRPTENTRLRTELLRTLLREHTCLVDANTRLYSAIPGNPVTFEGVYPGNSGVFYAGTDFVVVSMGSPGRSTSYPYIGSSKAALSVGTPSSNEVVFTSVKKQWEGSAFPAADANAISVEIVAGAALTVDVKGASGNLNHIYITVVSGSTTCQQMIDAVNAHVPANTLVLATLGSGSTGTNAAALWGTPQWAGDYTLRFLKGGVAGVLHTVPVGALSTFFAASTANRIQEGDMIGIWYDKNVDTTGTGGRLQSTYENGNYAVTAGMLFNSRREPEKIPNCTPLCKCINPSTLLFADGSFIQTGFPAPLGFDSLQWQWVSWGEANLAAYCYNGVNDGILRVTTGTHGHNPAVSIREAFENTDEQIYALRGHTGVFVSVTDGTSSTGGRYNSATALEDAVTALLAGNGGTIYVRKGSYVLTAGLLIGKTIRIIGVEEGVVISHNGAGYAFTLAAANCHFENLTITSGSGSNLLNVQADDVTFTQCFVYSAGVLLYANASANRLHVCHTKLTGAGTGQQLIQLTAGSCTLDHCLLTVPDNNIGLRVNPGGTRLTISDTKIVCSPFTTSQWVVNIEGGIIRLDNVEWTVTGSADMYTGVLNVLADELSASNLYFDMGNQRLRYGSQNSPIMLASAEGVVDGLVVVNAGKIPTSGSDGFILNFLVPYVRVAGVAGGLVTLRNANLSGFSMSAAPSGAAQFTALGDESTASQRYTVEGRSVFENVHVDLSGLTHTNVAAYYACYSAVQPASKFQGCVIELGATGYLTHGWYIIDTTDVNIDSCTLRSTLSNAIYCLIEMAATISGANSTYRNAINNCSFLFDDMQSLSPGMINLSFASGANAYHTITNNRIHNTGTTATGKNMITLAASVMRTVVTSNTIKKGSAGNTAIADAGTANLWQTATSSDPLNVIF